MPPWKLKAAVQGALSLLPDPQRWNRVLQTYVTHSLDLSDEYFLEKWAQAERHVALAERLRGTVAGARIIELGTGWFPIIPIGLALSGAGAVWSVDAQDLLAHERVVATLRQYHKLLVRGWVTLRPDGVEQRLDDLLARADRLDARALLAELGITSMVADARAIDLPAGSIDMFVSNNTLEHIPRQVIADIFREFRRLAATDALGSHYVDMADHYAGFDRSISVYNFLQYSDKAWKRYNNSLQYQNRLRVSDFRALHRDSGWQVIEEDNVSEPVEVLRALTLAPEFRRYDEDDLRVFKTWMLSRPV
jgi:hypothetical protein